MARKSISGETFKTDCEVNNQPMFAPNVSKGAHYIIVHMNTQGYQ